MYVHMYVGTWVQKMCRKVNGIPKRYPKHIMSPDTPEKNKKTNGNCVISSVSFREGLSGGFWGSIGTPLGADLDSRGSGLSLSGTCGGATGGALGESWPWNRICQVYGGNWRDTQGGWG